MHARSHAASAISPPVAGSIGLSMGLTRQSATSHTNGVLHTNGSPHSTRAAPYQMGHYTTDVSSLNRQRATTSSQAQSRSGPLPRSPVSRQSPRGLTQAGGNGVGAYAPYGARGAAVGGQWKPQPLVHGSKVIPDGECIAILNTHTLFPASSKCTWTLIYDGPRTSQGASAAGMQHMFHNGGEEAGDFIKEVRGDEEGLLGDMESRPNSAMYGIPLKRELTVNSPVPFSDVNPLLMQAFLQIRRRIDIKVCIGGKWALAQLSAAMFSPVADRRG
eukprot:scaffold239437_cov19-Tisochrysis_lutea.AAC.1